jgi:predicted adenine nucleotide alpha hydrolase (AANH) superfamily ATPase
MKPENEKILLHACCGLCAVWPVERLREEGFDLEAYFFNPNIHPLKEFSRRKETFLTYARIKNLNVHISEDFLQERWEAYAPDDPNRCVMCYKMRLKEAARFAKENGYGGFTSTLFVSPYQNHELMREIALEFEEEFKIPFLYRDFRVGFRQGQSMAKEMGLYRQKYCGCIHSYNASPFKEKITWD